MRAAKNLWLPFLVLLTPGIVFSLSLPYFPVDETRYLSVAWEMKLHNSFIVPLQNGLPYSHKPPLLFWLFNLNWWLFGVNEGTLRYIPLLFGLLNITVLHRIALLLWNDEKVAGYAAIILSSTFSYLLWSSFIMFDIVLTFWVLLAIHGLLSASRGSGLGGWLTVGISMGGGLLTKGPAVFVYILPVALLYFLWIPKESFSGRWYGWLALSTALGIGILLVWLAPAVMTGGKSYREAVLWGQTVNRLTDSFAHRRPFWWYLPCLPGLLLPWVMITPSWRGLSRLRDDPGVRLLTIWGGSTLVIFSLISGKQLHYLIPVVPASSLLMARNLVQGETGWARARSRHNVAIFYGVLGIAALALCLTSFGSSNDSFGISGLHLFSFVLIAISSGLLFFSHSSLSGSVNRTAISAAVVCALLPVGAGTFLDRYDLREMSRTLKLKQDRGYSIIHYGKYHGQYQFIGRLERPLLTMQKIQDIRRYAATHENVALITYEPPESEISMEDAFFRQRFRGKQVVLWNKRGIYRFLERLEATVRRAVPVPRKALS